MSLVYQCTHRCAGKCCIEYLSIDHCSGKFVLQKIPISLVVCDLKLRFVVFDISNIRKLLGKKIYVCLFK